MPTYCLPQVADSAIDLLDDRLPVWVVWTLGVAHVVWLAVVQRHQVEVFLRKPFHHRVNVLTPLGLVVIRVAEVLQQCAINFLPPVFSPSTRVVEGSSFKALKL